MLVHEVKGTEKENSFADFLEGNVGNGFCQFASLPAATQCRLGLSSSEMHVDHRNHHMGEGNHYMGWSPSRTGIHHTGDLPNSYIHQKYLLNFIIERHCLGSRETSDRDSLHREFLKFHLRIQCWEVDK